MAFVFYNPNPAGKRIGDCVVRAISKLTEQDWKTTYIGIAIQGYMMFDMPSSNAVWAEYLRRCGYCRYILPDTCPDCYSIKNFCADYPEGRFLLATGDHVVAVVDGDYFDAWDSGNEIPIYFGREVECYGFITNFA